MADETMPRAMWQRAFWLAVDAGLVDEFCSLRVKIAKAKTRARSPFAPGASAAVAELTALKHEEQRLLRRMREIVRHPSVKVAS